MKNDWNGALKRCTNDHMLMRRFSVSLAIREMQNKITMKYHYTFTRMTKTAVNSSKY